MFIAMNRFRVKRGSEADFEQVWLSRDTPFARTCPASSSFICSKVPSVTITRYMRSHTVWQSHAVFEAWTRSEAFRAAHARAGENKPLYLDHPQFEGFEIRQTVPRKKASAA